jgi:hypothetical protein
MGPIRSRPYRNVPLGTTLFAQSSHNPIAVVENPVPVQNVLDARHHEHRDLLGLSPGGS